MTVQSTSAHDPAKRARLIESAAAVFSRVGFERAGVDEVAKGAGVAKGTVYLYFENKADLFRGVLTELRDRIEAQATDEQPKRPEEALRAVIRAQLAVAAAAPDLFRCYTSALFGVNRDFQTAALAIFERQQSRVIRELRRLTVPARRTKAIEHRASLFLSSLLAAALISGLDHGPSRHDLVEDALMAMVGEPVV